MSRVTFRPTVPGDFIALAGEPPQYRSRCVTAVLDGRALGLGGIVYAPGGEIWASVWISEEGRRYPLAIHRAGLAAIAQFKALGLRRVFAAAQPDNPAAERWLERLGFVASHIAGQKVFIWNWKDGDRCAG